MPIYILDDSLKIEVYYESNDHEFEDNVCISYMKTVRKRNEYIVPVYRISILASNRRAN